MQKTSSFDQKAAWIENIVDVSARMFLPGRSVTMASIIMPPDILESLVIAGTAKHANAGVASFKTSSGIPVLIMSNQAYAGTTQILVSVY